MNKRYQFRAECQADIDELLRLIPAEQVLSTSVSQIAGLEWAPDRECTIELAAISLVQLRRLMGQVPDGHVMVETVTTPGEYTGERA